MALPPHVAALPPPLTPAGRAQLPYEETLAFNPGSFATDLTWMVYRPAAKMTAERSSLQ